MSWKNDPFLVLDLETTGPNPDECYPVQVGWVWFRDGEPVESDSHLVKPPIPIPQGASEVHGIRDEHVVNAPTIEEVAPVLLQALAEAPTIAGYNAYHFDFPILRRLVPDFIETIRGKTILDPIVVVRLDDVGRYWRGRGRHRLVNAARSSGIEVDEESAHGAVYDCELAGRILWRWRDRLPDEGREAQRFLRAQADVQEANFRAWKARQPAR